MIPILYDRNEIHFASNGLGRLRDIISCVCYEERNSIYEVEFEYPVNGANYDKIKLGQIIGVTHDESGDIQPFDIVSYSRPIDGVVTFHAVHISYRQRYITAITSGVTTLNMAFLAFKYAVTPADNPFTYTTDITASRYLPIADGMPHSVRQMLGGAEGSILDTYDGEYEWDKFNVILHTQRGKYRDFTIRYGVNLVDYNEETDSSETFMACIPYWTDGTSTVLGDAQTAGTTITNRNECVPLDVSDKFEQKPTKAQVEQMGLEIITSQQPYLPTQNIKVDFIRLQDEAGFDQFDSLLQCKLCDSVKVVFPQYDMSAYFKIVKTTWNVLQDRYDEMELGSLSTTLAEALGVNTGDSVTAEPKATIVETGAIGIWNYRRWSDGTAECWGTASADLSPYYSGGGFYAYRTGLVAFPAGLFTSAPIVNVDGKIGNGFYLGSSIDSVSETQFEAIVMSTDAGSATCVFYIHAISK